MAHTRRCQQRCRLPSGSVAMGAAAMMGGSAALKATNVTRNVVGSIGAQAGRNLKTHPLTD